MPIYPAMVPLIHHSRRLLTGGTSTFSGIYRQRHMIARFLSSVDSSVNGLVETNIDEERKVATLTLNRPPVNSLSLEMCKAISSALKAVEREHPHVHGLVLASSNPSILSAGLDLMELQNPDPGRLPDFWGSFQQVFLDLYGSRLACVAAIEGHAPAAGCMLALCCDYRIMSESEGGDGKGGSTIGLSETKLGIAAPYWLGELMAATIGIREAEKALGLGLLYSPEQALKIGLVDEVVPKANVLEKAHAEAAKWASIPPQARVASKLITRQKYLDHLKAHRKEDMDNFCAFVQSDAVQTYLTGYLEKLKKKRG